MKITVLQLPWFDPSGKLHYETMRLTYEGKVGKKYVRKLVRTWYKDALNVSIPPKVFDIIWKERTTSAHLPSSVIDKAITQLAIDQYKAAKEELDNETIEDNGAAAVQDETTTSSEPPV